MHLGNSLSSARKKSGLSQEEAAGLSVLYHMTLDELVDFDGTMTKMPTTPALFELHSRKNILRSLRHLFSYSSLSVIEV